MCGRFTLRTEASAIAEHFAVFGLGTFEPRFNIAPSQPILVVRLDSRQAMTQREIVALRWGLIPSWAKDVTVGNRLINARSETAAEKPSFRAAMRRRRCLIPADGFYEWEKTSKGRRPYFIHHEDDKPFAFAGLWESWEGPDHLAVESCTVLTTEPNELIRPIHDRMPVILSPDEYETWLDPADEDPSKVSHLLCPTKSDAMVMHRVDTWVNSPANDDLRCVEPAEGYLF